MRFDVADHDVHPLPSGRMRGLEHGGGLAHSCGIPEENFQHSLSGGEKNARRLESWQYSFHWHGSITWKLLRSVSRRDEESCSRKSRAARNAARDTLLPGSGEQTQCVGYIQIDSEDIDGFPAEYAEDFTPCMCLYNRFQLLF